MPSPYTVDRCKHATFAAPSTAEIVNLDGARTVTVLSRGADAIYFTLNGVVPTVAGDDCYMAPANQGLTIDSESFVTQVQVISATAIAYSVMAR